MAAARAVALYVAETWWHGEKRWCKVYQKLINGLGRALMRMFRLVPSLAVVVEVVLLLSVSLHNYVQCR